MQGPLLVMLLAVVVQESPPGLRRVEGGPTRVGSTVADVERWIREGDRTFVEFLAGETPQRTEEVDDFWLMVTEVTEEQYAVYVQATGARPPHHWAPEPVEAARIEFLRTEGHREPEATRRRTWDPGTWWDANWRDHEWAVPAERRAWPVVNVSQGEAEAYARWAGLRLMDEAEFARACRGDTGRVYPWGDAWDEAACNSIYLEPGGPTAVGSFPATSGFFDLAGNVWEWTRSSYEPFEGYAPIRVTVEEPRRRLEIEALAPFDHRKRVAVGGSYLQREIGLHAASRRAKKPTARERYLGFRCALGAVPGADVASAVIDGELKRSFLPDDVELEPARAAIHQRWSSERGTADVPGYAVITGYERVLFCPVARLPVATRVALQRKSADDGPVPLGFLSTSLAVREPELEPGTYVVAWRAPGKVAELDPLGAVPGLDPEASCLVFLDPGGLPVAAVRAADVEFGRLTGAGTVAPTAEGLRFALAIPGARREGLSVALELATAR